MFSKFLKLEPEKQIRIINAAIKEFAHKGYKNASTNEIVKDAGISKGLLFHYFKNKKNLFLYLYDYSNELLIKEFDWEAILGEGDFFARMRTIYLLEYKLFQRHPEMYDFYKSTLRQDLGEVKDELEDRFQELAKMGYKSLYENLDVSKFRDGIDAEKAMNTITWAVTGFLGSLGYQPSTIFSLDQAQFDELLVKVDEYIEFLRGCFYKSAQF